jgi:hypothetical protein
MTIICACGACDRPGTAAPGVASVGNRPGALTPAAARAWSGAPLKRSARARAQGGAAEHIARQLDARLREQLAARQNPFSEAAPALAASLARPLLCLFDRNFELSVVRCGAPPQGRPSRRASAARVGAASGCGQAHNSETCL